MPDFLDEFYALLPAEQVGLYQAMSEEAIRLGFKPKREKTKHLSITFASSKYRATLLKYAYDRHRPEFRLKFFAAPAYSAVFDQSIKRTLEEYNFRYTGCYGCGRCRGEEKEGYIVRYEDGREYFRCGSELITIDAINAQIKDEVLALMQAQAAYYADRQNSPCLRGASSILRRQTK